MNTVTGPSIAIMQPYFFPYLGYFQLIAAVDKFVIYDDVHYIKSGWINRNRILVNGKELLITLPIQGKRSFTDIKTIELANTDLWLTKTHRTLQMAYGKAPYFNEVNDLIQTAFDCPSSKLSELLTHQLRVITNYLGIRTELIPSSSIYNNKEMERQDRLIDICLREKSKTYINPLGGQSLYTKDAFAEHGIHLYFLEPTLPRYTQAGHPSFVSGLSIIDLMMNHSPAAIRPFLRDYSLT
ncbi:WbqC family protein [Verrucomicrobiaceae bacterium N1E253]|uniref:WbqC family protein n=1 Tax=Oceaniferula marina TaxID=2748318 RepID=A0A851GP62_9BACT|nr:WbqC family protein [Oceaniferula marina]NWK56817.1 WbqC family protein [Oceaniferula marina]